MYKESACPLKGKCTHIGCSMNPALGPARAPISARRNTAAEEPPIPDPTPIPNAPRKKISPFGVNPSL